MSRIVVLVGSVRKGGNTEALAQTFAEGAGKRHEVELISVADCDVHPCIGCNSCYTREGHRCFRDDDMQKIYDRLKPAGVKEFKKDDAFTGFVYRTEKEHGAFVAVIPKKDSMTSGAAEEHLSFETLYYGLIPPSQVFRKYKTGEQITGRVVRVRADRKHTIEEWSY